MSPQEPNSDRPPETSPDLPEVPEFKPSNPPPLKRVEGARDNRNIGLAASIGAAMIGPVVLGLIIGLWLDHHFHTNWISLVGLVLGIIVGFIQLYEITIKLSKDD
ncbi:MAG: AtpZ/AtpI family protein [Armatimonadetes bacterium]|nr:AtpZ/AtpI family protein [Armatimonadota bacterium]